MSRLLIVISILALSRGVPRSEEDANYRDQMKEAIRLHDAGDYEGALEIYRRLIKTYPDDGRVLHEMALTTSAKGDYKESISLAERALKKGTADPAAAYSLIGSDYDSLEKYDRGEKAFREGLERYPDSAVLHFNLGINLGKQGKMDPAAQELKEDLRLRPDHPGGWLSLAKVVASQGEKVKEFLAFVRFLTLEPESSRSKDAASQLWPLMFNGVVKKPAKEPGKSGVEISLAPPSKRGEKERGPAEAMSMAVVAAGRYTEEWQNRSDVEFFAHGLETITTILSEFDERPEERDPFWGPRVNSYFRDAREHGHMEAMAYDVRRSLSDPEILQWLEKHSDAVAAYRAWSKTWKPEDTEPKPPSNPE